MKSLRGSRAARLWLSSRGMHLSAFNRSAPNTALHDVVIPKAKLRTPTAVLEVLRAATIVEKDATGAHFSFHDDPYLIPGDAVQRHQFALSKELGQRAAREIVLEWPELFEYSVDDPPMAFYPGDEAPRPVDEKRSSDADLSAAIADGFRPTLPTNLTSPALFSNVAMAQLIYANAVAGDVPLSDETKLSMLELLAWSNPSTSDEADFQDSAWPQERFFRDQILPQEARNIPREWERTGEAEALFSSLEPSPRALSALIQGLCRHGNAARAWALREDHADVVLGADAYAALIETAYYKAEGNSKEAVRVAEELMATMAEKKVAPTLAVFNSTLCLLSKMRKYREGPKMAEKIFQEMARVGVIPSPGSHVLAWRIFELSDQLPALVEQSLTELEKAGPLELRSPWDARFAADGMGMLATFANSTATGKPVIPLANRLDRLVTASLGPSFGFVSASQEADFYGALLRLNLGGDADSFFAVYERVVPGAFVPDMRLFSDVLEKVRFWAAYGRLPQLWTDMVRMGLWTGAGVTNKLALTLNEAFASVEGADEVQQLQSNAKDITRHFLELMNSQFGVPFFRPFVEYTAAQCTNFALVAAKGGDFDMSWEILTILFGAIERNSSGGSEDVTAPVGREGREIVISHDTFRDDVLKELAEHFLANHQLQQTLQILKFAEEMEKRTDARAIRAGLEYLRKTRPPWLTEDKWRMVDDVLKHRPPEHAFSRQEEEY